MSALGHDALVLAADAADPAAAGTLIHQASERFGQIHGLAHVAGGSGRKWGDGPLHEATDEGWEATLSLNLTSCFYSLRAIARHWLQLGQEGSVAAVGSVLAGSPAPSHFATHAYAAAKAGQAGLVLAAAAHYASESIRFNLVQPALTATPMSERAMGSQEIQSYIRHKMPLQGGGAAPPEAVASAIVYLLSDESKYVTGQVISVDGGWSVSDPWPEQ